MENLTLLEKFANPELIKNLSMGEKFVGSLIVTVLGMLVTFVVLSFLWGLTAAMTKMLTNPQPKKSATEVASAPKPAEKPELTVVQTEEEDDEELIAVITAAVAASLQTSLHNIQVRNIVRIEDATPAWGRAGRIDQMNSRF